MREPADRPPSYSQIAGGSLERLGALSDGVFAIAMTLLVLDLKLPAASAVADEAALGAALVALGPRLLMFGLSFLTLGIFWTGQQTQLNHLARGDRALGWLHLAFLGAATLMPFSTMLLAEFMSFRVALALYWLNLFALGATLYASWRYAVRSGFLGAEHGPAIARAIERRIVVAQALYGAAALACVISIRFSIGAIVALQLYYAFAPRLTRR